MVTPKLTTSRAVAKPVNGINLMDPLCHNSSMAKITIAKKPECRPYNIYILADKDTNDQTKVHFRDGEINGIHNSLPRVWNWIRVLYC